MEPNDSLATPTFDFFFLLVLLSLGSVLITMTIESTFTTVGTNFVEGNDVPSTKAIQEVEDEVVVTADTIATIITPAERRRTRAATSKEVKEAYTSKSNTIFLYFLYIF